MTWTILVTDTFEQWFTGLNDQEQIDVLAMVEVLEMKGPSLSRPYADTVSTQGNIKNLKELRIQHYGKPYRVLYAFDPHRQAILLCGGRKDGKQDKSFYKRMIPLAKKLFSKHLVNLNKNPPGAID